MSDMTIRDPDAMLKFAYEIDVYCDAMQRVCRNLQSNLSSASPMMKDEKSRKALQKIDLLANDLISGLPEAKDVAERLRAAAKPLKEAQWISI
jgi:hypothetical protein